MKLDEPTYHPGGYQDCDKHSEFAPAAHPLHAIALTGVEL
jgi:hypothetical protein